MLSPTNCGQSKSSGSHGLLESNTVAAHNPGNTRAGCPTCRRNRGQKHEAQTQAARPHVWPCHVQQMEQSVARSQPGNGKHCSGRLVDPVIMTSNQAPCPRQAVPGGTQTSKHARPLLAYTYAHTIICTTQLRHACRSRQVSEHPPPTRRGPRKHLNSTPALKCQQPWTRPFPPLPYAPNS